MVQKITKGIKELTEEARKTVQDMSIEQAKALYADERYVFVDVREAQEREKQGLIPGAFTCPRGMLEFLIDPECPAHNKVFAQDKTYVFYCAHGLRSLYAAKIASEMGIHSVKNLAGGFAAWQEASGKIQQSG
ncbi:MULTISPECIES: rhodanese-like domain-containing protein [Vibrio]|uniref:rhodanese-like domain-containing protein n=1 Tax=Vibrio TaxID=662 RepID=UPI0003A4B989|nr:MULTISPECIES: rhodanese-like domain-containing protein [Vibrio]UQA51170.1 rhodanese-like domain-containing protein [Vibrio sp. ED002]